MKFLFFGYFDILGEFFEKNDEDELFDEKIAELEVPDLDDEDFDDEEAHENGNKFYFLKLFFLWINDGEFFELFL